MLYQPKLKNTPPNKTPDDDRAFEKSHIESFPAVKSHFCRKNSHTKYLDSTLNLTKTYDFYKNHCTEENSHPVKIHIYRSIFNSEYNYGFYKPKKDVCKVCDLYEKATSTDKTAMSTKYEAHLQRKLHCHFQAMESFWPILFEQRNIYCLHPVYGGYVGSSCLPYFQTWFLLRPFW